MASRKRPVAPVQSPTLRRRSPCSRSVSACSHRVSMASANCSASTTQASAARAGDRPAAAWPHRTARIYSGPTRRIEYASSDRPLLVSMATISSPLGAMNISVVTAVLLSNVKFPVQFLLTV
jgi:hypothetical protein